MLGREGIQLLQELFGSLGVLGIDDLVEGVDEDLGDVVVARVQAGDEAEQSRVAVDRVILDIDEACVIRDIELELIAPRDADDAALFFLYSGS